MAIKQVAKGRVIGLVAAKQPKPDPEKPVEKKPEPERVTKRK